MSKKKKGKTVKTDQTGTTWRATLPCPLCAQDTVIGILLVKEDGAHQHTRYYCTFWGSGLKSPCEWMGWSVPGWDKK